ncbi:MAG: CPBP family intramembrane glutamic endopeptidase [Vicinamibacterales bacterium]
MKGPLKFAAVVAVVVSASLILAPLLHDLVPYPFPRTFKRLLMIGAILAGLAFVRIRKDTVVRLGLNWTPDAPRFLRTGLLTGLTTLALFAAVAVVTGHAEAAIRERTGLQWLQRIGGGLLTGILIGFLEEVLFRGFVFTYVRDRILRSRVFPAMVVTSLVYASLHFLDVRTPAVSPDPGIADGVRLILAPFRSLADWPTLWPAAVGLFLFGMILNVCVVRTGSLYPSIGLHAGTVTFLRVSGLFLKFGESDTLIWGSKRVYDGVLGWVFLLIIGALLVLFLRRSGSAP